MNGRVTAAEELYRTMFAWSDASPLNRWDGEPLGAGPTPGRIPGCDGTSPARPVQRELQEVHEYRQNICPGSPWGSCHPTRRNGPEAMEDRGFYRTFCRECPFKPMMDILKEPGYAADLRCGMLGARDDPPV